MWTRVNISPLVFGAVLTFVYIASNEVLSGRCYAWAPRCAALRFDYVFVRRRDDPLHPVSSVTDMCRAFHSRVCICRNASWPPSDILGHRTGQIWLDTPCCLYSLPLAGERDQSITYCSITYCSITYCSITYCRTGFDSEGQSTSIALCCRNYAYSPYIGVVFSLVGSLLLWLGWQKC